MAESFWLYNGLLSFNISEGILRPTTCPTTENQDTRYCSIVTPCFFCVVSPRKSSFIHSLVPHGCNLYHGRYKYGCSSLVMNVHFHSDKALAEQEGRLFSISSNTKGCPPLQYARKYSTGTLYEAL